MKLSARFAGCALFVWLAMQPLAAFAQTDAGPGDELISTTEQNVDVDSVSDDGAIEARLRRILVSTGWFEDPQVSVREGIVFLDGVTGETEHRVWAGELASRTVGAVAIVNRITVRSDLSTTFGRASDESLRLWRQFVQAWPIMLLAVVIAFLAWIASWVVAWLARWFLASRIESPLLLNVVVRAASIPILLLGIYFILQIAGLTRLAITVLGGTGLLGIIIGFAFRDIAENFLASLLLSARNPFRTGDLINVAGHEGVVQNLNTRSTVLLTLDGNHVQIPNATVFKNVIKNYSSIPSRRAEFVVGIGYDSPAAKAQDIIADVLRSHPAVLDDPEPLVLVDQLGAATVDLRGQYWFDSETYSPAKINSAVLRLTKNALMNAGIEMPDSEREVVFPKGVPIIQQGDQPAPKPKKSAVQDESEAVEVSSGEGDLASDALEVEKRAPAQVPEGGENLLKPNG